MFPWFLSVELKCVRVCLCVVVYNALEMLNARKKRKKKSIDARLKWIFRVKVWYTHRADYRNHNSKFIFSTCLSTIQLKTVYARCTCILISILFKFMQIYLSAYCQDTHKPKTNSIGLFACSLKWACVRKCFYCGLCLFVPSVYWPSHRIVLDCSEKYGKMNRFDENRIIVSVFVRSKSEIALIKL